MVVPTNGLFIVEKPIKTDDLGVPPFQDTSIASASSKLVEFESDVPGNTT